MTSTRGPARRIDAAASRAALVALVGLVIAGIFAMHVLGSHDQAGEHSMPASMPTAAMDQQMHLGQAGMAAQMGDVIAAPEAGHFAVTADTDHGMSGSMGSCVLFLAAVGGLVLALLLAFGSAAGGGVDAFTSWSARMVRRRGPPTTAPPHFSLCVLRV